MAKERKYTDEHGVEQVLPEDTPERRAQQEEEMVQVRRDMRKAREAAARKRKKRGKPPVPIGEMEWLLIGFHRDPYKAAIIGTAPNRFRLRHKWDAVKEIAAANYDGVYVMRGKRYDVNSL